MELYKKYLKEMALKPKDYESYYEIILKPHVGKKINGWLFSFENMQGAFVFSKKVGNGEQLLYATPFLEGMDGIAINLIDEDGAEQYTELIKIARPTGNSKKDAIAYFNALKKYLTV
jgi:hypothetical protein